MGFGFDPEDPSKTKILKKLPRYFLKKLFNDRSLYKK